MSKIIINIKNKKKINISLSRLKNLSMLKWNFYIILILMLLKKYYIHIKNIFERYEIFQAKIWIMTKKKKLFISEYYIV